MKYWVILSAIVVTVVGYFTLKPTAGISESADSQADSGIRKVETHPERSIASTSTTSNEKVVEIPVAPTPLGVSAVFVKLDTAGKKELLSAFERSTGGFLVASQKYLDTHTLNNDFQNYPIFFNNLMMVATHTRSPEVISMVKTELNRMGEQLNENEPEKAGLIFKWNDQSQELESQPEQDQVE